MTTSIHIVERFLEGRATPEQSRGVVRALLRESEGPAGSETAAELDATTVARRTSELVPAHEPADYEAVLDRVARAAPERAAAVESEHAAAAKLLEELAGALDPADPGTAVGALEQRVRDRPRYHSWALVQALCRASLAAGLDDARRAVALARLAVVIGDAISGGDESPPLRHDLRALAHAHLGNAQRIASDFRAAERSFERAAAELAAGTGDPLIRAWTRCFEASLASDRSRFDEALRLCRRARHLARRAGARHLEGRIFIQQATLHAYQDDVAAAISTLERGLELADVDREPRLVLVARHNLISYLDQAGRPREALDQVPETRALAARHGHRLDRVRLRWLEGRVALALGRGEEGARALVAARDAFLEQEIGHAAALVSLELALHHAARGERARVRSLAEEMVPIFASKGVHREAQAALRLFYDAAVAESAEHRLVLAVLRYLERAQDRPGLRFEPPPSTAGR